MGHGKESPRQKMIGLMYLFLTCLLALNVSKDILDAFIAINNRMNETNKNFVSKNEIVYSAISAQYASNQAKWANAQKLASEVKAEAAKIIKEIQDYKHMIIIKADGLPEGTTELPDEKDNGVLKPLEQIVSSKDNVDIPAQLMVLEKRGTELKGKIEAFRAKMIKIVSDASTDKEAVKNVTAAIEKSLNTDAPKPKGGLTPSWESENFEHLPLMAVITIMTQMQVAARNVEGDVVNHIYTSQDADAVRVNTLASTVIPSSNYVMVGSEYKAQIFLAAFDSTKPPTVRIGRVDSTKGADGKWVYKCDAKPLPIKGGRAIYTDRPGSTGEKAYGGLIEIEKGTGEKVGIPFRAKYMAAQPALVISPTKMNVFYIGVPNPVEISVPGVPSSAISANMSSGSLSGDGKGGFIAKVTSPGKLNISVSAKINGQSKPMGVKEFRVKRIPDPVPIVGSLENGSTVSPGVLSAYPKVIALLKDFDFDAKFVVTKFNLSMRTKDGYVIDIPATSEAITSQQKDAIRKATIGQKIYFDGVEARGPDGTTRKLGTISYKIK